MKVKQDIKKQGYQQEQQFMNKASKNNKNKKMLKKGGIK